VAVQSAFAAPVALVKCRAMQSDSLFSTIQLSSCNRPRITGGSGTTDGLGSGPFPLTWSSLKTMSYSAVSATTGSLTRCPDSTEPELDFLGTISSAVGPWTKRFIGATVSFDLCLNAGIELVPGTAFTMSVPKP
jgi:hypothetical protein